MYTYIYISGARCVCEQGYLEVGGGCVPATDSECRLNFGESTFFDGGNECTCGWGREYIKGISTLPTVPIVSQYGGISIVPIVPIVSQNSQKPGVSQRHLFICVLILL